MYLQPTKLQDIIDAAKAAESFLETIRRGAEKVGSEVSPMAYSGFEDDIYKDIRRMMSQADNAQAQLDLLTMRCMQLLAPERFKLPEADPTKLDEAMPELADSVKAAMDLGSGRDPEAE